MKKLDFLQGIIDDVQAPIFFYEDQTKKLVLKNDAFEMLGFSVEGLLENMTTFSGSGRRAIKLFSGENEEERFFDVATTSFTSGEKVFTGHLLFDNTDVNNSQQHLSKLLEGIPDSVIIIDKSFSIVESNSAARSVFGDKIKEGLDSDFLSLLAVEQQVSVRESLEELLKEKAKRKSPLMQVRAFNSQKKGFLAEIAVNKVELGAETFLIASVRDVSQRVEAERELKKSEEKFRAIYDQAEHYIGLMDTDGTLLEANKTALDFGGISLEQVRGKKLWESFWWTHSKETVDRAKSAVRKARNGEVVRFEEHVQGAEGVISIIDFTLKPIHDAHGNVVLLLPEGRDITTSYLMSERMKASEQQLRLFVKHTPAAVAMFDKELRYLVASDRWYTEYGIEDKAVLGKTHYEVFPEISENHHWREIHQRCLSGEVLKNDRDAFEREDGDIDYIKWEIHPWYKSNEEVGGIIMFTEVITESIRNEKRIESEKEKAENYLRLAGNIILILDRFGRIELINDKGCEVIGYGKDEILGKSWIENFIPADRRANVKKVFNGVLNEDSIASQAEEEILNRNGFRKSIAWKNSVIKNADGEVVSVLASGEDITSKKAYEEKIFRQAQIINQIREAVITADFDGVAKTWNPGAREMFGFEDKDFIGKPLSLLSPSLTKEYFYTEVYPELRKSRFFVKEIAYSSSKEKAIYGNTTFTLQHDRDNNEVGLIISVSDITSRVVAEKELLKNAELLSKSQTITQMGSWEWTLEDNKLIWSEPLFHIFEVDKNTFNLNVDNYLSLIHPDDRDMLQNEFEELLKNPQKKSYKVEHRIITSGNRVKFIESIGYRELNDKGQPLKIYGTAMDISARKASENQISKLNEALERRVEERTEQLRLANAAIADREQQAKALNLIISGSNSVSSINELLELATKELLKYLNWNTGQLYVRSEKRNNRFDTYRVYQLDDNNSDQPFKNELERRVASRNDFYELINNQKCKWESDTQNSANTLYSLPAKYGYKTVFSVPVFFEDDLFAVMEFYSKLEIEEDQKIKKFFYDAGVEISRFITRKQTELALAESEEKFRQLAENIEQVLYLRTEDKMLYLSPSFENMYGITREWMYQNPRAYQDIIHGEDRDNVKKMQALMYENRSSFNMEYRIKHPEKGLRWIHARSFMFRVENTDEYRIVGFVEDVTEYKQLTSQLVSARDEAEQASKAKSEFLANMSHEIRTPLNAIIGFSDLIQGISEDKRLIKHIEGIKSSGGGLLRLINDILDLSKIEANKLTLNPQPVSLKWMFGEVLSIFEQKADEKSIQLKITMSDDFPEYLLIDEVRIRQILFNLLGNAIKFTDKGAIELNAVARSNPRNRYNITIHVIDTGIGIPEDQQEKIFESFTQQDGQNLVKTGGTGLGLAITRRLTEAMSGSIELSSKPGEGSKFTVKLFDIPGTEIQMPKQQEDLVEMPVFSDGSVLVVDDSHQNVEVIKEFLVSKNLRVQTAYNGLEALNKAKENNPDLILLDIKMPVLDGFQALERLKADPGLKTIPVVAVTASAMRDSVEKIKNSEFDDYLLKPLEFVHLYQKLEKFFTIQSKQKTIPEGNANVEQQQSSLPKERLYDLVNILEKDYFYQYENARNSRLINEIVAFGKSLQELAGEYGDASLEAFADQLLDYADAFDTGSLYKQLEKFPTIINEYKRIINK